MTRAKPLLLTLDAPKNRPISQAWLLTMADFTSILLCFFVLLYTVVANKESGWQAIRGSISATFAPSALAVAVVPDGQYNTAKAVPVRRGVAYLDTVLRQRLAADPIWQNLSGTDVREENAYIYPLAPAFNDITNPTMAQAWLRLGAAVRIWQTPLAVRVVVPVSGNLAQATTTALTLAQAAAQGGARVTAEVRRGNIAQTQWVIYGAE
jgi:hypothetical protein